MPVTLTSTNVYGAGTVSAPAAGEPRTSLSVRTGMQQLLNMAGYLKSVLDGGVTRLRTTADLAALKALTGQTTGDHAVVKNLGLYEFDAASALTVAEPVVVQPTVGGGRWLHVNRSSNVANGFATLDSGARVPAAQLRGQIISRAVSTTNPSGSGTLGSPGEFGVAVVSQSLTVGQVWEFFVDFSFKRTSGSSGDGTRGYLSLTVVQPDTSGLQVVGARALTDDSAVGTFLPYSMRGRIVAEQAGTHSLKFTAAAVTTAVNYEMTSVRTHAYLIEAP